jgi:EmrB/QacA subfamily drug resistance transporter
MTRTLDDLDRRQRTYVLLICSLSLFIIGLDVTVVNVALPSIEADLNSSITGLQWTVGAYSVVMASLLLLSGSTADRLGRRRTLITGVTIFTVASIVCALAPSIGVLIAGRILQAIGASMMNPVAMSIITNTFTDPRERAQAIGIWGAVFGVSMALGPVVGGLLVESLDWRWIFWINLPVGIGSVLLMLKFIPESKAPSPRRFDALGQALVLILLSAVTYGIIEAPELGWSSPVIIGVFAAGLAALLGLLVHEPRTADPVLDLRFFRSTPFSSAIAILVSSFACFGGFLFLSTLYLQEVRGLSPLHAGMATLPMAAMIVIVAPISGRMVGRHGPRIPLVASGICMVIACLMLTGIDESTSLAVILTAFVIFGIGSGFVNPPSTNASVSGMPRAQAGVASAVASTSRQFGQALGVAVAGAIVTSAAGDSLAGDIADASGPAWWTLGAFGFAVLILGFVATTQRARESALRTATDLNPEALAGKDESA